MGAMRLSSAAPPISAVSLSVADLGQAYSTVSLMRELIEAGKTNPVVVATAHSIIYLCPERDIPREISAIYAFVRDRIKYVADINGVETLSSPDLVLSRESGDCDDQTTLLCSLLESIGYQTRLVMAEYDSGGWEHVYCQVLYNGQWWSLEPIFRGGFVGYEFPNATNLWIEQI